jgi:hypothetical protein
MATRKSSAATNDEDDVFIYTMNGHMEVPTNVDSGSYRYLGGRLYLIICISRLC